MMNTINMLMTHLAHMEYDEAGDEKNANDRASASDTKCTAATR
jgi:hypothetical protein